MTVTRGSAVLALLLGTFIAGHGAENVVAATETRTLTLQRAISVALARDALVRDAQQSLDDARASLVQAKAHTPRLAVGANSSAASSAGLDPQSAVSGTDYSSQSYSSEVSMPLGGGTNLGFFTSASTSTTNSQLRTGEGQEFTFAGAAVGAGISRPLGLFRNERVLTEGARWSAELSVRGAELALEQARRHVVSDTLTYFFAALQAQRQAALAEASVRENDELLRIAQEKLKLGKLAEIEVMETQVSAASADVALRQAQAAAATALDSLRNYLGMSLDQPVEVVFEDRGRNAAPTNGGDGQPGPVGGAFLPRLDPAADEGSLIAQALARRPDLQQLALGLRQTELSVQQAEAQARPGVRLVGSYSKSGEAPTISESFSNLVNPSWAVGVSTSLSLTRSEDRAAIEQARGHLRLAHVDQRLRQDDVRLEVRRLVREVQAAADNVAVLDGTVKLAEENLRIRQTQLDHGLIRPIDVMQTERQLSDTRSQHLNAIIAYQLSRARLSLAVGEMPAL